MRHTPFLTAGVLASLMVFLFLMTGDGPRNIKGSPMITVATTEIKLPRPRLRSETSLEEALVKRRSVREFSKEPLSLAAIGQLLWAAQGITDKEGKRTAPSAGALYPLEVYLVCHAVENVAAGVYQYRPSAHTLEPVTLGDKRRLLAAAAGMQSSVNQGAAILVIAADYTRTSKKYGDRATRYVHMEAGHAAQNVCLQATALNLGTVVVGAFNDLLVRQVLSLPDHEQPLYLMPVGK